MKGILIKIAKGAMIATLGALATYMSQIALEIDFGIYTPFVAAGFSIVANAIRVALAQYQS